MLIGDRIRALREAKNLSQGDIEKRSGLLRPYLSRIENGHTVPALETIEKFARALEVPLYQMFYEGEEPPKLPGLPEKTAKEPIWGARGKEAHFLGELRRFLGQINDRDRKLLLAMAKKMARD